MIRMPQPSLVLILTGCTLLGCAPRITAMPQAAEPSHSETAEPGSGRGPVVDFVCDSSDGPVIWSHDEGEPVRGVVQGLEGAPVGSAQIRISRLSGEDTT